MDLSAQQTVLDIDGILAKQIENNVTSFGTKLVVKWSIIPIIEQGPIFRVEKKEREGTRKNCNAKKSKFWLMRVCHIKILCILVSNIGEIYLFGKSSFLSKTMVHLASWQPKNCFNS